MISSLDLYRFQILTVHGFLVVVVAIVQSAFIYLYEALNEIGTANRSLHFVYFTQRAHNHTHAHTK